MAVAIRIEADAAAVEVARLGVDVADLTAFKNQVTQAARISGSTYTARRGDKIENRSDAIFVNGAAFAQNMPRIYVKINGNSVVASTPARKTFNLAGRTYDFNGWTTTETPAPKLPTAPKNLTVQ